MKYVSTLDNSAKIIKILYSSKKLQINNFDSHSKSFDWLPEFIPKMKLLEVIDISSKYTYL